MDLTDVALIDIGDDPYPPQVGNLKGGLIVRILAHITVVKDVCRGDISRYRCFQKGIGSASQAFDMGDGGEATALSLSHRDPAACRFHIFVGSHPRGAHVTLHLILAVRHAELGISVSESLVVIGCLLTVHYAQ